MTDFNPVDHPHRRYNPLLGEYVLVSPHRNKRPWQGKVEAMPPNQRPPYDPQCYLCPDNVRANGEHNPHYEHTFVFTNDFAALLADTPPTPPVTDSLFQTTGAQGTCRVICFSPRHDLTLPEMELPDLRRVVEMWSEQVTELGAQYQWVQVFETKGDIMGTSNPHPHGQIWASDFLPNDPAADDRNQAAYYEKHSSVLLVDYVKQELEREERLVVVNDTWVALVPYWAYWPFETIVLPRRHVRHIPELNEAERDGLADILKRLLTRYDNLFEVSFPYGSGWHGQPFNGKPNDHWQLHLHYFPPLLRSATVKKFVASYELMAEGQRDITPEQAAARLREVSEVHYKQR